MRVQVNLSDEMVKRVDDYADKIGVTRSALCGFFIGQGILGYDNASTVLDSIAIALKNKAEDIKIK